MATTPIALPILAQLVVFYILSTTRYTTISKSLNFNNISPNMLELFFGYLTAANFRRRFVSILLVELQSQT